MDVDGGDVPDLLRLHVGIGVAEDVADIADLVPGNVRVRPGQLGSQLARRLGDDLDIALYSLAKIRKLRKSR
jgi:hypothetical protein